MKGCETNKVIPQKLKEHNKRLPIFQYRHQNVQKIHENKTVLNEGEIGSGKTTQGNFISLNWSSSILKINRLQCLNMFWRIALSEEMDQ